MSFIAAVALYLSFLFVFLFGFYLILKSLKPGWFADAPTPVRVANHQPKWTRAETTGTHKAIDPVNPGIRASLRAEAAPPPQHAAPPPQHREPDLSVQLRDGPGIDPVEWQATGEHRLGELIDDVEDAEGVDTLDTLRDVIADLDGRLAEAAHQLSIAYIDPMLAGLLDNGGSGTLKDLAAYADVPPDSSAITERTMLAMTRGLLRIEPDTQVYYLPSIRKGRQAPALDAATIAEGLADHD